MRSARLLWQIAAALWRSGLLRLSPWMAARAFGAWWRCGNTYAALAEIAALRFPDRCALHDGAGPMTFAVLHAQSEGLAAAIANARGCGSKIRVGLLCGNDRGFVLGLLALGRLGADVLPLDADSPGPALRRALEGQPVDWVLHDPALGSLLAEHLPSQPRHALDDLRPESAGPTALPRVRRAGKLIVLTSGSTGAPKGVGRAPTLSSLLPPLAGLLDDLPLAMHRPAVLAIPLHHGYGLTTLAMTLAMAAPLHLARRFEIGPMCARLGPLGAGPAADASPVIVSVPTLLGRWLRAGIDPSVHPAAVITGSAPLDPTLCAQLLDALGPVLFNLYGSTEAGVMALATPRALREAPGTVGTPLPGTAITVVDGQGAPVAPGEIGAIRVRGPLVLEPDARGGFDTGDLGRFDAQGRLFVCGRTDAMFISGGENVYPEETVRALRAHPLVADAAVSVVPDPEFGQGMRAHVVIRGGAAVDAAELRDWLRARIARAQLPRELHLIEQIPRNALGKVDRVALEALSAKQSA